MSHLESAVAPFILMSLPKRALIWIVPTVVGVGCLWCWTAGPLAVPGDSPQRQELSKKSNRTMTGQGSPVTAAFDQMRRSPDREGMLRSLDALRQELESMPTDQATAWMRAFLNKGGDKPTGLSFVIGNDRDLSEWPTFRTFLIDTLSTIDPEAAAAASRDILSVPTSADEWALALRNVGRTGTSTEDLEYLRIKTEALIANPEWQEHPSIGYLNAFDVLVHTDATGSTPLLSGLIRRKDRKDLAHAGFLTLDRLVQRNPADVLTRLTSDRMLQESRPEMVAQQFARADLRDADQREIVKSWLLDPSRTDTELRSFAGIYPNSNRFISNNLLTRDPPQSGGDLASHDREALEIISMWREDPAFQHIKPCLATMQERLVTFVSQSAEMEDAPQ